MIEDIPLETSTGKLLIERQLFDIILPYKQFKINAHEAGGILLGYRRDPHIHITEATAPHPKDSRARFRFLRHKAFHQRIALKRWKESDETLDYVGEWHTHPEDFPVPSAIDLKEWMIILKSSPRPMIFIILGRVTSWIGIGFSNKIVEIQSRYSQPKLDWLNVE